MKINYKWASRFEMVAICSATALAVSSCGPARVVTQSEVVDLTLSLCRIVNHEKDYVGQVVNLQVVYKSDNVSYSYFEDLKGHGNECVNRGIIQLGYISKMHDKTVLEFFKAGDAICRKKRSAICVLTADVDFSARVLKDQDGLYLHLEHVTHFQYY